MLKKKKKFLHYEDWKQQENKLGITANVFFNYYVLFLLLTDHFSNSLIGKLKIFSILLIKLNDLGQFTLFLCLSLIVIKMGIIILSPL